MLKKLTSSQVIILGFAGVILLGTLLLMLPFSTGDGEGASFSDALFTATSAVCVTGLIVRDTATYWSSFGQAVLLVLIQVGGMGVMTIALTLIRLSGRRIGLKQRSMAQEAISAPKMEGIVRFTGFILSMTAGFELLGAVVMSPRFIGDFGFGKGLWYAVFHSVSAFCNAGFDLMGSREPFSSLTSYSKDPLINVTVMALIIIGGIGFLTWQDIKNYGLRFRRYSMQSKVVLVTSGLLLLIPAVYFFFFEFLDLPAGERAWVSIFQSVTARTAGFNTADLNSLSEVGLAVMILLMLVGGSPGSTAGGMKTTTLAVLLSNAVSVFRKREDAQFFGRRVPEETGRNASTLLTMYLSLFLLGGFVISRIEDLPLISCLFETASAIGTVGVTLGITPTLGLVSRGILILLMYFGRVGGLTLVFAAFSSNPKNLSRLPEEKLTVG